MSFPPSVNSSHAGQLRLNKGIASVRIPTTSPTTLKIVEREFGANVLRMLSEKQRRLLPSRRVKALKIPPVRLLRSTPV